MLDRAVLCIILHVAAPYHNRRHKLNSSHQHLGLNRYSTSPSSKAAAWHDCSLNKTDPCLVVTVTSADQQDRCLWTCLIWCGTTCCLTPAGATILVLLPTGLVQVDAEFEAACELHDCPMMPVVLGHFLQENYVFQVSEDAGQSLDKLQSCQGWHDLTPHDKAMHVELMLADIVLALACNVNRVCDES